MTLFLLLLLAVCGLPLFLRAAVFLSQSVCPPAPRRPAPPLEPGREAGRLVLCPVCDDVNEAALRSVLTAAQGWGRVVMADDSGPHSPLCGFGIRRTEDCADHIFRRGTRAGWKAGNVNAALRAHGEGVREFIIMDADTVAGPELLRELSDRLSAETREVQGAATFLSPLSSSAERHSRGEEKSVPLQGRGPNGDRNVAAPRGVGFIPARLERAGGFITPIIRWCIWRRPGPARGFSNAPGPWPIPGWPCPVWRS